MDRFKIGDRVCREKDIWDKSKGYKTGRVSRKYSKPAKKYVCGIILGPYKELYEVIWDNGDIGKAYLPHGLDAI